MVPTGLVGKRQERETSWNTQMNIGGSSKKRIGGGWGWTDLAQDTDKWWALGKTVITYYVRKKDSAPWS